MKKHMGKLVGTFWRQALFYVAVIVFIVVILWWHLGTLVPGLSLPEEVARMSADSFRKLVNYPLFLPHKIIQYAFLRMGQQGAFWLRTASALWGVVILAVFYDIIRSWYSRRIALMSGALLLTSAWFLHFARLGTPYILYATSIGLLWIGMKLKSVSSPRIRTVLASILILIICLYVPGLPWLILPMLIWQRKTVLQEFKKIPKWITALTVFGVTAALSPLVYGLARHPMLIFDWLLVPAKLNLSVWWTQAWHLPIWLIFRGPEYPVYWLGHMPMLDSLAIVMGVLGIFVLSYYRVLDRVKAVVAIILLALILTILNGWLVLTIALPLVFVVIAAGVALFLQQWFTVFPNNPLARTVGVVLVTFVVVLAGVYNLRSYFVAWPKNAETKQVFDSHLLL